MESHEGSALMQNLVNTLYWIRQGKQGSRKHHMAVVSPGTSMLCGFAIQKNTSAKFDHLGKLLSQIGFELIELGFVDYFAKLYGLEMSSFIPNYVRMPKAVKLSQLLGCLDTFVALICFCIFVIICEALLPILTRYSAARM